MQNRSFFHHLNPVLVLMVLVASVALAGCLPQTSTPANQATEKVGDTTLTGVLSDVGGHFFIDTGSGQPQAIDSYAVTLTEYAGQKVTITGQYSGNVLFVGSIKAADGGEQGSFVPDGQTAVEVATETDAYTRPAELKTLTPYEKQQLLKAGVDPTRL